MNISLVQGSTTIVLNGTGAAAPLRGSRFKDGRSSGEELVLEIALDGTAAQIGSWISALALLLGNAARLYGRPGENWGYLVVTPPGGEAWQTPIISASLMYGSAGGAAARVVGSQGLILTITRPDYWEDTDYVNVPLTNRTGTSVNSVTLDNHEDSGHDNFARIAAGVVAGDLPAPAWLYAASPTSGLEMFWGEAVTSEPTHNYMLEAEDGVLGSGVTGADTADANCSNGNYVPLAWSGTGATMLEYWDLGSTVTGYYRGRLYRPVLRLRDLITSSEKFWLWWRIGYNVSGTIETIQDFEGVLCPVDRKLVVCPPMPVPPWPKPPSGWSWEAATVALMVQAEATGSHALNLDFVHMMPVEGWLRLIPMVSTVNDTRVTHDASTGTMTRTTTGMASHAPEGSGLWLWPGVAQTLYMLNQAGNAMSIGNLTTIQIRYKKRVRAL